MNNPTFDDLARLATIDYEHIDWRMAFSNFYLEATNERRGLLTNITELETKLLAAHEALTVSPRSLESSVAAAATALAELTGESCHVEVAAWYHPDHTTSPKLRITHGAYRAGQIRGTYEGDSIEEACAKVREDWERAHPMPAGLVDVIPEAVRPVVAEPEVDRRQTARPPCDNCGNTGMVPSEQHPGTHVACPECNF